MSRFTPTLPWLVVLLACLAATAWVVSPGRAQPRVGGAAQAESAGELPSEGVDPLAMPQPTTTAMPPPGVDRKFRSVPIFIDTGDVPLAAYQVEVAGTMGTMGKLKIISVGNGDAPAFADPPMPELAGEAAPFHDEAAVSGEDSERIVLADFSLADADALPHGVTRVATVELVLIGEGEPRLTARLIVAADPEGKPIRNATVTLKDPDLPSDPATVNEETLP